MQAYSFQFFLEMEIQDRVDSEEEVATEEETVEDMDNRVLNGFQGSLTETGDVMNPDASSTFASATAPHSARLSQKPEEMLLLLLCLLVLL